MGVLTAASALRLLLLQSSSTGVRVDLSGSRLVLGAIVGLGVILIAWRQGANLRKHGGLPTTLYTFSLPAGGMLAIGLILASITLGSTLPWRQHVLVATPPGPPIHVIEINQAVYFDNGSDWLSAGERARLNEIFRALADCPQTNLNLAGFASSARFPNDPDGALNFALAGRRAATVENLARTNGISSLDRMTWKSAAEMNAARGILDAGASGARLRLREFLNRRVDIKVRLRGACVKE